MRLHRFFIQTPLEHTLESVKDERVIHQWRHVFRYNVGSEAILFDGSGMEYDAVIQELNNREAQVRLVSERMGIIPESKIILFQSLIKKDKMEWVVEKATELGVSRIVPVVSDRSEKKGFNTERAKKIAIEAAEQCGRADVPEVAEVTSLERALENCGNALVFDPSGESLEFEKALSHNPTSCSFFIGPEGGWTEKELEKFKQKGAQVFSLGPLVLRAETAAVVALSKLLQ